MSITLKMDFASTQSEILAFLEQAQEENLRHDKKSKGSMTAFRLEKSALSDPNLLPLSFL